MLFLSQNQQHEVLSCESTVNGLAASAASMKTNIAQVGIYYQEKIIALILAKHNDTVLKLIHRNICKCEWKWIERVNISRTKTLYGWTIQ